MLYEHAARIIVKEGFDGLSMQKLATAVNISAATIYVYFSSKEDMLCKIYNRLAQEQFHAQTSGFDPLMPFKEGLWLLWKNNFEYNLGSPVHAKFLEQFRHSPFIDHNAISKSNLNGRLAIFFQNAMRKNELLPLPPEIIKALAIGPLQAVLQENEQLYSDNTGLNERKLKRLFEHVIKTLQPV